MEAIAIIFVIFLFFLGGIGKFVEIKEKHSFYKPKLKRLTSIINALIAEVNALPDVDDYQLLKMKKATKSLLVETLGSIETDMELSLGSEKSYRDTFNKYRNIDVEMHNMVESLKQTYQTS